MAIGIRISSPPPSDATSISRSHPSNKVAMGVVRTGNWTGPYRGPEDNYHRGLLIGFTWDVASWRQRNRFKLREETEMSPDGVS